MSFIPTSYFLDLLRNSNVSFSFNNKGSIESPCEVLQDRIYMLDYFSSFKISQRILFKYLIGLIDIQVYALRGRKKHTLKGRIIGTNGNIIRSISASTKTRVYTLGFKFSICGSLEDVDRAYRIIKKIGDGRSYGLSFRSL